MDFFVRSGHPEKQRTGCVIVGIYERRVPSAAAATLDALCDGAIGSVMRRGDMDGKLGQTLVLHRPTGLLCDRVLLVGLGRERNFNEAAFRKANLAALRALRSTGAVDAASYLTELVVKGRDPGWMVKQALFGFHEVHYRFDQCKGRKDSTKKAGSAGSKEKLLRLSFAVPRRSDLPAGELGLKQVLAITRGMELAKNLGNLPGNLCTPTYLAEQAQALAKQSPKLKTKVLEAEEMEKLGMGALLSVAKGSRQPAKLIVLDYQGGVKNQKPIALVGKGLTFDAGGISLKPAQAMDEMKYDMCGGASVLAALKIAAELQLPLNLVGVVPSSENLPDGAANKPGDIVTSMAGITIEVLNTDAEGRLILCDALTYVERHYEPECIIDIATLTGACVIALGGHAAGLFSNSETLARRLLSAGEEIGDRAWQLPLWEEYQEGLKSPFADVANISGNRDAGAIIGASFLHRFMRKQKWAHLDIAGAAWKTGPAKGATGRPVPLLAQFLLDQVQRNAE
ncbi:MAG: leucyl aminopeptidase [Nevskiales bacterium]